MPLAPRPRRSRLRCAPGLVLLAAVLLAGCGGDDDGPTSADLVGLARDAAPELTDDQARCLVDRTTERLGSGRAAELAREGFAGSGLSDEVATIRDGCLVEDPSATAAATTPPTAGADQYPVVSPDAHRYGDDPTLDELWDRCAEGSGQACDDLYYLAPLDSEYEAFGYTCGQRDDVTLCSELDR